MRFHHSHRLFNLWVHDNLALNFFKANYQKPREKNSIKQVHDVENDPILSFFIINSSPLDSSTNKKFQADEDTTNPVNYAAHFVCFHFGFKVDDAFSHDLLWSDPCGEIMVCDGPQAQHLKGHKQWVKSNF